MAKFCTDCGSELSAGNKFCVHCGATVSSGDFRNDSASTQAKTGKALADSASSDEYYDQLWDEFPELLRLQGEANAWMPLLSFLSIPGWTFFAWGAWGFIDWLSILFAFGAVFFFLYGFYSLWKFHTYSSTARQTEILIRALRNPSSSDEPEARS